MSQNQCHKPDTEHGDKESPCNIGIGALFRDEREKMGLTYAQLSESTRLRPYTLEALEHEDWDSLPSSVFVKGFVRTYARALGLEEGVVMELYQKAAPVKIEPSSFIMEPSKSRKKVFLFLVAFLLIMAFGYYVVKESPFRKSPVTQPDMLRASSDVRAKPEEIQKSLEKEPLISVRQEEPSAYSDAAELSDTPEGPVLEKPEVSSTPAQEVMQESMLPLKPGNKTPESLTGAMTLRAEVREKTWVRIFVDEQDPKEYIFRPGSSPEWKAKEGFELLIGNACGIGFEFNGRKIDNLGERGQVVRLKMPEDYQRRHSH